MKFSAPSVRAACRPNAGMALTETKCACGGLRSETGTMFVIVEFVSQTE